ncbi:MAG TPA: AAA family ATPase [Candidatus Thiothrix moscowensis]|uniref:ATP-binding protein n=1 Tax=Thiothrix sp. UBA2016 TaxID=1947695 RepID=UPI0025DB77C3|nr:AAA family ATPase [Thiothrix sp. UBA2016]HRJ53112.1 AAA family ATPase [Candidatus Thiothrix moscowensis]HRJ93103.1 AAA family ATPase [Candidatus Thiothrix moscowensis]
MTDQVQQNDLPSSDDINERYLAAALTWLRLKLTALAPYRPAFAKPVCHWWCFWRYFAKPVADEDVCASDAFKAELEAAEQAMLAAENSDPPPAMVLLARRLGLTRFEQLLLLLCAAPELDTRIPQMCARAQDDHHKPYPTFALAFNLFSEEAAWDALSPERPLRYWRLLEINQPGATPLTTSALRADERIVNYLKGLNELDDRLSAMFAPLTEACILPPSQLGVAQTVAGQLDWLVASGRRAAIQLVGADGGSKQQVVRAALQLTGSPWFAQLHPLRLRDEQIPVAAGEFETFVRLWERESRLLPIALYIEVTDGEGNSHAERVSVLGRLLGRIHGLAFLDSRDIRPELGTTVFTVEVQKPTPEEQQLAWRELLGKGGNGIAARLAGQFNFNLPTIHEIAGQALSGAEQVDVETSLRNACLGRTRLGLDKLAQRIDVKADWGQIVLPEEPLQLLHTVEAQVGQRHRVYDEWGFRKFMNRGLGISALFAGESGTGKTMAAEVIAKSLGLDLYRIDLSAVVSKYIGETEKNLRRVFDAAEDGGAILFFDEADALFGKRSEVKDSHDRYANIEINYLLQRMEAFGGLAILATNLKHSLDQAFMRRLRFIVDFPFPAVKERKDIWLRAFPSDVPLGEVLDYERLAKFSLSGGSIHNIALNAAFMAAQEADPDKRRVTMRQVLQAVRAEFRKLEKPVNERDFILPDKPNVPKLAVVGQQA